jgi:enoyl-CoA hydratase/carnithine racemase
VAKVIETRIAPGEPGQMFYERRGHIGYFVIDGPTDLNAATPEMHLKLFENLQEFRDDEQAWVGIITGAGERAFSVGGDLKNAYIWAESFELRDHLESFWYPRARVPKLTGNVSMTLGEPELKLFKPMIAAVNGYCLGAGLIRLCCFTDIRIAGTSSKFGFTEVKWGLGGGGGGWASIVRQIGYAAAMKLCLTGESVGAEEAYEMGLINEVVADGEALERAEELAAALCERPPTSLRAAKEVLLKSFDTSRDELDRLAEQLARFEVMSHDFKEAAAARAAGRAPEYRGW